MKVGVLGAGQLARLLAQAGESLGLEFVFLSPLADACAAPLGEHICAEYDDVTALARLASRVDVVTFEFENVPGRAVEILAEAVSVRPSAIALAVAQDRLREKQCFEKLGIPTPRFRAVSHLDGLREAVAATGMPAMLKTRTQGYDGKGQAVLRVAGDLAGVWQRWGNVPSIVEALVPFDREVSIIAVRGADGGTACYPLTENYHREGMLRLSLSREGDPAQARAEHDVGRLLDSLDYVGVLALELFEVDGRLCANEIAPRVHNSGHWTIEGARTSQFENHLRAICGLPLGETTATRRAAMVNLIGRLPALEDLTDVPGATVHVYGKAEQPNRKLGHVTLVSESNDPDTFLRHLIRLLQVVDEQALIEVITERNAIPNPGNPAVTGRPYVEIP